MTTEIHNRAEAHRRLIALGMPADLAADCLDHEQVRYANASNYPGAWPILAAYRRHCAAHEGIVERAIRLDREATARACGPDLTPAEDPLDTVPPEERERIVAVAQKAAEHAWRFAGDSAKEPEYCAAIAREVAAYHTRTGGPEFQPAIPHHTVSETGGLELNWTFAIHTDGSPASAEASLEALFAKWAPLLAPYLNGEQLADLRGDVVRAVDASRPGLTEEEAQAWADDLLERTNAGPGRRALVGDALLLASRGETGPTPAALPEAQATDVRSVRRRLGLTQEALGEKIGYRGETISRWENGHEEAPAVVRLALIGLAASGGLAPRGMPSRAAQLPNEGPDATPGHVLIPRAILERLAKAAASDSDAREARWAAERILQRATLAAERARTDPLHARVLAEATQIDARLTEPIPDSIGPRGSSYDGAHAPARVLCPTCERWHFPTDCCQA